MKKATLAHAKQNLDGEWELHSLEEHLHAVASLAGEMAAGFASSDWAHLAGLWHDLGKYRLAFQSYISSVSGYDPDAHIEQGRVDHSTAGAIHAVNQLGSAGQFLAYLIAGHHAGLPDWNAAEAGGSALSIRLNKGKTKGYLDEALQVGIPSNILQPVVQLNNPLVGAEGLHLWSDVQMKTRKDE